MAAALLLATSLIGTAMAADDDVGAWAVAATSGRFGEQGRLRYTVDTQARYFDIGSGINQWLLRPGIGTDLSATTSAWLGYARFRTRGRSGAVVDENRYWQDFRWNPALDNGGQLGLRFRLEQRDVSVSGDVGLVLRAMARYTFPARDGSAVRFFVGAEPFMDLNTTDWSGGTGLSQNRFFAGIDWPLGDNLRLETTYMQQYFRLDGRENLLNHLAVVVLRF